jgi:hypothetical protein
MIKLKSLLLEEPQTAPTPTKPVTKPDTDTPTKPTPRRKSTPDPSTSPTPGIKGKTLMGEESGVMKQIVDRYMAAFNKLSEADYDKIFDPETLGKLKGSVSQRIQGKNPMQIVGNLMQLAQQVMQLEQGSQDLLEQLAYDIIYEAYPYLKSNEDVIEIDAKIVPQDQVKEALQPNSPQEEDIEELSVEEEKEMMDDIAEDLKKRRLINAVTQGASTFSKSAHYIQQEYIDIIGGEGTSDKYRDLMQAALDMIDFTVVRMGDNMGGGGDDLSNSATGAESVFYDFEKEKWIIKARAIVFPVLILEIVKGMYEIIGLFGFSDLERGEKVVKFTDKITNEPEDIAYGQLIAKNLQDLINKLEVNVTPEERDDFLQDIYKLENKEFIQLMTNIINNNVTSQQMNQLKGMFKQMRQDKTADDADNALFERLQRLAGL